MTDDDLRLGAISCRARYAPGTTALAYTVSRDGSALGRVHSFAAVAWLNAGDDPREIIARRLNEFDERRPRRTLPPRSTSAGLGWQPGIPENESMTPATVALRTPPASYGSPGGDRKP